MPMRMRTSIGSTSARSRLLTRSGWNRMLAAGVAGVVLQVVHAIEAAQEASLLPQPDGPINAVTWFGP